MNVCQNIDHRTCKNILEILNAAVGVKYSAAITELKDRMKKMTNSLEKKRLENEQQLSKISAGKKSAAGHIKALPKYKEIEKQRKDNA